MSIFGKVKKIAEAVQNSPAVSHEYSYGKFAVLDVETTGLNPNQNRIVELCLLTVHDGKVIETWTQRFNPEGPVGKTEIHGITDKDVENSPLFKECISEIQARIENIAVIAHNARFDLAFLRSEFERAGYKSPWIPSICTLNASMYYQPHLSRRRLADCCEDIGIELIDAHSASGDAVATAQLFHYFLDPQKSPEPRKEDLEILKNPSKYANEVPSSSKTNGHVQNRIQQAHAERNSVISNSSYKELVKLLKACSLSEVIEGDSFPGKEEYLEKVIEFLADGKITNNELNSLQAVAIIYGLTEGQIKNAHLSLLIALAAQALKDESVSAAEREELLLVAENLGISKIGVSDAIKSAKEIRAEALSKNLIQLPDTWKLGEPLRVGQKVVFTGCDPEQRADLEKESKKLGVAISSKVSKKTSFLITDGSYVGNKANDALALGVRVVTPDEFELLLKYLQPALIGESFDTDSHASSQSGAEGLDPSVVRTWAITQGIEVSPKGRIHSDVYEQYKNREK